MELNALTVIDNEKFRAIALKKNNINMTPKEDKIFGAFLECPLAPLEDVPTYKYMTGYSLLRRSEERSRL